MGKSRRSAAQSKRATARKTRVSLLALAALVVLAVGGGYLLLQPGPGQGKSFSVKGGETKPVLDPLQFQVPQVRQAYMAAAQYPEAMDQVYCYCLCDRPPFYHKSLLSCFTDYHGSS